MGKTSVQGPAGGRGRGTVRGPGTDRLMIDALAAGVTGALLRSHNFLVLTVWLTAGIAAALLFSGRFLTGQWADAAPEAGSAYPAQGLRQRWLWRSR